MQDNTTAERCHECGVPARYSFYGYGWCSQHRGLAERFAPRDAMEAARTAGAEAARNAPPLTDDQRRRLRGALMPEPKRPAAPERTR
jgi:hypothetical protein